MFSIISYFFLLHPSLGSAYFSKEYSSLSNRRVSRNKHGGGKDEPFLISVVPGISVIVGKMSHS